VESGFLCAVILWLVWAVEASAQIGGCEIFPCNCIGEISSCCSVQQKA
jgi:hypothetical protein